MPGVGRVTILVELAIAACGLVDGNLPTIIIPHAWVGAVDNVISWLEVDVAPIVLPLVLILAPLESSGLVQVSLEPHEVAEPERCCVSLALEPGVYGQDLRGHGIVQQNIHASLMDGVDEISPVLNPAMMLIEQGEVQRTVTVGCPRKVDKGASHEIDGLDAHAMNVVEVIDHSSDVSAEPELVSHPVMFESGSISVVVGRITVRESVQCKGVSWHAPVVWRRCIGVIFPFSPVVERMASLWVLVQVPVGQRGFVGKCDRPDEPQGESETRENRTTHYRHHCGRESVPQVEVWCP